MLFVASSLRREEGGCGHQVSSGETNRADCHPDSIPVRVLAVPVLISYFHGLEGVLRVLLGRGGTCCAVTDASVMQQSLSCLDCGGPFCSLPVLLFEWN